MDFTAKQAPIWDQWNVGVANAAADAGFAPFATMQGGESAVYDETTSTAPPPLDGGSSDGSMLPKLLLVGLVLWAIFK